MPLKQVVIKRLTLAEIHAWIVEARELVQVEDYGAADEIVIHGAEHDQIRDINACRRELKDLMKRIQDFDASFHDKFDCR